MKSAADSEWEDKGRDSTGKNGETQEVRIATEHLLNRPLQVLLVSHQPNRYTHSSTFKPMLMMLWMSLTTVCFSDMCRFCRGLKQEQETGTWPFIFHPGLRAGAMLHCTEVHHRARAGAPARVQAALHRDPGDCGSRTGTTRKRGSNKEMPQETATLLAHPDLYMS